MFNVLVVYFRMIYYAGHKLLQVVAASKSSLGVSCTSNISQNNHAFQHACAYSPCKWIRVNFFTHFNSAFVSNFFKMFCPSSALRFVQGAPLRLCGRLRNVELLSCSQRLLRPMPLPGTNFQSCMLPTQHYLGTKEIDPLTVDDYHVLIETGRLDDRRVELLNGLLIKMHAQSVEHQATTRFLFKKFFNALQDRAVLHKAAPITLFKTNSEPEPDIFITSGVDEDYDTRKPVPSDILLVVEISKSTIVKDSTIKLTTYASEGIREYWIVDIEERKVQVFRQPQGNSYESKEIFSSGFIAPAAFSDVRIRVKDLFRS